MLLLVLAFIPPIYVVFAMYNLRLLYKLQYKYGLYFREATKFILYLSSIIGTALLYRRLYEFTIVETGGPNRWVKP